MHKWLWIGIIVLCVLVIGRFFSSDNTSFIRVSIYPASIYWDGREIITGDKPGFYKEGSSELPATIEYRGTVYVPLSIVGRHLNKPVGWDHTTHFAWVGQPPALGESAASASSPTEAVPADLPPAVPASAAVQPTGDNTPPAASEKKQPNTLFGVTLGMSAQEVTKQLGEPARKEPSSLGYQWWIYNSDPSRYVQIGIADDKVVDVYSLAPQATLGNVGVGTNQQSLERQYDLQSIVSFSYMGAQIQMTNQKQQRPLVMSNGTPYIYYLDKENGNKVTAVRMIDTLMLLRGGFYETKWTYRGKSPDFNPPALSVGERELVNAAYERQILDLVNVSRYRYKLPALQWNEKAAQVARTHSHDMEANNFFDHISATTGASPFDRLKQASISYSMAGENIAAGYPDAIEAHESWMNSPGHRKNVLEKDFTQLGVGVIADYYTQAFLTPSN
ncbi:hypothetical protein BRE01_50940 [Brevibacillus reuszeri]|uniref:Secretion protein n=1 Tax=Brevibacillus reuszeri TaxID=54915 RepID=A0A0K9YJK5_9BACL|nr:CAP-associated domain-containing protein [Brevibacillus reuszeri]KNB68887.1 secretion protein [Brevibacillus reuszeri]MED1859491.1 CAP-associated domain-containing protein [Brevibacillus reuszeri]GED71392.1 hypothetical protein BRE01_50940 [Brevibacillus reuszeri]